MRNLMLATMAIALLAIPASACPPAVAFGGSYGYAQQFIAPPTVSYYQAPTMLLAPTPVLQYAAPPVQFLQAPAYGYGGLGIGGYGVGVSSFGYNRGFGFGGFGSGRTVIVDPGFSIRRGFFGRTIIR